MISVVAFFELLSWLIEELIVFLAAFYCPAFGSVGFIGYYWFAM